jgi:hypothetical protein
VKRFPTFIQIVFYSILVALSINCKSHKINLIEYLQKTDQVHIKCAGNKLTNFAIHDKDTIDKLVKLFNLKGANEMPPTHIELSQIEYFNKEEYLFTIYYTDKGVHYLFKNEHYLVRLPAETDSFLKGLCK